MTACVSWRFSLVMLNILCLNMTFDLIRIYSFAEEEFEEDLKNSINLIFDNEIPRYSVVGANALARSVFIDRQERLQINCDDIIHRGIIEPEMFDHLIVDDKHKLLYCYVPKVACTNWKRVLMIASGKWSGQDPLEIPANVAHSGGIFRTLTNYTVEEIEEKLSTYNKLIVVRHPFERLLSAYRNKLEAKHNSSIYFQERFGKKIIKKFRKNATQQALEKGNDVTFPEFVDFITDDARENGTQNEHWRPITELCHPCLVNYNLISKYETLADDATEVLERMGASWVSLLSGHPNTYTFTKALAEHVVGCYSTKLPIVVVRPSIVSASWKEPVPRWVDGVTGPIGLMIGAGKGLFRSVYGTAQLTADLIPVDACVNLFISAAWKIGLKGGINPVRDVRVYDCVSGPFKSLSWNEFVHTVDSCTKEYAMSDFLMSPKIRMTNSRVKHVLRSMVEQTLPAVAADSFIRFSGGSPRLWHHYSKLKKLATLLEFFTTHEFQFKVDNVKKLKRRLNPTDQVIFNFDVTEMNWKEYLSRYFLGVRKHVMNEKDDTIPVSRQRVIRPTLIETVVQIGVVLVVAISCSLYALNSFRRSFP